MPRRAARRDPHPVGGCGPRAEGSDGIRRPCRQIAHGWQEQTVDLDAALKGKTTATIAFRVIHKNSVANFGHTVWFDEVEATGLDVKNGHFEDGAASWTTAKGGRLHVDAGHDGVARDDGLRRRALVRSRASADGRLCGDGPRNADCPSGDVSRASRSRECTEAATA